ncbi:MAG: MATE family efflux transporter [Aminipila sp.]
MNNSLHNSTQDPIIKDNSLQKEFNFIQLIKFSTPTIAMMLFMSLYSVVDGIFVSRFIGTDALSSLNIAYPLFNAIIAIGVMLGAGGSALIAKKMGEAEDELARKYFSLIIYTGIIIGTVITILGAIFMKPLLTLLGATDALMQGCMDYGFTLLLFTVPTILQMLFQYLFITAGKPHLGLSLIIFAGIANMIFDYIFIVPLDMGIAGAALATGLGILVPAVVGMLYFTFNRKGSLYFTKTKPEFKILLKACANGSSEMVTELSNAVITFLYNMVMLRLLGSDGVAAITILLYFDFMIKAALLGFSMGVSPIISYNYGSGNIAQIKRIFKYSFSFIIGCSLVLYTLSMLFIPTLTVIFAPEGSHVYELVIGGFKLYSISFLFTGISIFSSALFTAFSNGLISATISFLRTFLFLSAGLIILPPLIGITGAWISAAIAEGLCVLMSITFILKYRKRYKYV